MSRTVCMPLLAVALSLATAAAAAAPRTDAESAKLQVPEAAAQKQAAKEVDDVYRGDLAAVRTPDQKRELAQKWLKAGTETGNDPAARYVLLTRAKDMAAEAGDAGTALAALAQVQQAYKVDPVTTDAETAGKLARSVRTPDDFKLLALYLNGSVNEAIAADRYDVARKLADLAQAAAGRANDAALARLTGFRSKDIRDAEVASAALQRASAAGPDKVEDPATKLQAGRLRALIKGDWDGGLPLLAAGSDAALKDLAAKDLAGPADGEAQAAVADQWWAMADKAQGAAKSQMQLRARRWYEAAAQTLSGLPKAKAEQRVKETDALAAVYGPKGVSAADAKPVESSKGTELPQGRFVREWRSPAHWSGKPETATVKGTRISITNNNGANVVCSNVELVREKDGTIVVSWNEGEGHSGYEVWSGTGRNITITRWDTKAQKDAGQPPKRSGFIVWK